MPAAGASLDASREKFAERLREIAAQVLTDDWKAGLQYGEAEGYRPLREWVAADLTGRGVPTATEQVLITSALFASALALSYGRLNTFIFRARDRFDLDAATAIVLNGLLVLSILAVVALRGTVLAAALAFLVARTAYLAVTSYLLWRSGLLQSRDPGGASSGA